MQPHTLVLLDRDGKPHTYVIVPHNPLEGMAIVQQLAGLGLEPLARTLEGALPQLLPLLGKNKGMPSAEQLEAVVGSLRLGEAMVSLSAGFARLPPSLIRQLLADTTRDGKPMGGQGEINLDFDAAYRANYGEMLRAVWEVIGYNGFLPVSGISQIGSTRAGRGSAGARRAFERAARAGVNWWVWRLVTSEDIPDGLVAIRSQWSFRDTLEGHLALDALEEGREAARKAAERETSRARNG